MQQKNKVINNHNKSGLALIRNYIDIQNKNQALPSKRK